MTAGKPTRMRIRIELDIEVIDADMLRDAAIARVKPENLQTVHGRDLDEGRKNVSEHIDSDYLTDAITALVDPFVAIPDDAGIGRHGSSKVSTILSETEDPSFYELFEACGCRKRECFRCSSFQLTPATARALWRAAKALSDDAYDDIEMHGDDPITRDCDWVFFCHYPRITYTQNAVWRRQAARAFDDLSSDLAKGEWPQLTCLAEEMALHQILYRAEAAITGNWWEDASDDLPPHRDDFDWSVAAEAFFQDTEVLSLFDDSLDSLEDEANTGKFMGDYRLEAWFESFANMSGRDGRRPFRR